MKKTTYTIAAILVFTLAAFSGRAAARATNPLTKEAIAAMTPEQKQALAKQIKQRVEEIRTMDKSSLTRSEKRELRAELRSLKKESNDTGVNKMYVYGAGIVALIIILLVIF